MGLKSGKAQGKSGLPYWNLYGRNELDLSGFGLIMVQYRFWLNFPCDGCSSNTPADKHPFRSRQTNDLMVLALRLETNYDPLMKNKMR